MNRFEMFEAMINRREVNIQGIRGKIVRIELEDGSGHNFNITLSCFYKGENNVLTIFVKG